MKDYQIKVKPNITTSRRNEENYKSLIANIEFSDETAKTIMITSTVPGEGKSTVSLHLASGYAKSGSKVLLVDCDLRKSHYGEDFRIPRRLRSGVAEILTGKKEFENEIFRTDIPGLDFLYAGRFTHNPIELFQSKRFDRLLESCVDAYDYIIVDVPPIASVIDAAVISKKVDGVVYVIASDEISCRIAKRGLEQLERANANILGTVLNKIKFSNRALYGTYGTNKYYYGAYNSYYGEEE